MTETIKLAVYDLKEPVSKTFKAWHACLKSRPLLTFGVFVTERCFPHVTQAQGAFAAAVDKQVTVVGVKLCRCDHLCQILHVGWLDVYNVWGGATLRKTTNLTSQEVYQDLTVLFNWKFIWSTCSIKAEVYIHTRIANINNLWEK